MALVNTRILSYPGNWFRVGLMLFIFFTGIALAGGSIMKNDETEYDT